MKNIFHLCILLAILFAFAFSQNITIKMASIDGPVSDIVWCGQEKTLSELETNNSQPIYLKKIVFIVTGKGTVYRSVDQGKHFESLISKFSSISENFAKKDDNHKIGVIKKIYPSDADPQFMVFHGYSGISFITENCGDKFQAFEHPEEFDEFKLNSIDKNFIIAGEKMKCEDNSPEYCPISMHLYISEKMGLNWRRIQSSVIEYSWACTNKYFKHLIPVERVIITKASYIKYMNKSLKNYFIVNIDEQSKGLETRILYSDNFFSNFVILSTKGYRFFLTSEFLYVLEAEDIVEKRFSLMICPNYYREYKLSLVELPIQRLKDHSFTILDSSESSIFMNVNHYGDDAKFGNVYVSNFEGKKFVLSLLHNVRDEKGFCDFDKVKSLEGVYIANHYEHVEAEKFKSDYNYYSNTGGDKSYKHDTIDAYKKSVITYDKGAYWFPIPAPETDIDGKQLNCHGECSLHLRGFTDKYSNPLYSSESAVGIIMGVGNTGIYLSQKPEEVNTYLSRDGGHTWSQVDKGSYIYEIGDHGGLIVMADDTKPTRTIKYSWNEGITWEYFIFSDEDLDITNIIIEPMNMSLKFLIYGHKISSIGASDGVIIYVDFSTLKKRVCTGHWEPGDEESDYEIWIPSAHDQSRCLFGKRIIYTRRKRNADCFNGEDYEKKNIVDFCPCGEEDWECEFGFYRRNNTSECFPISAEFEHKLNNYTEPENCSNFFEVPSGYRKVPGVYCVGGIEKPPTKQIRCKNSPETNYFHYGTHNSNLNSDVSIASTENNNHHKFTFYLKIGLLIILVLTFIYIFREYIIDMYIRMVDAAKKFRERHYDNKQKSAYGKDYERVGAPLKSMNDEDDEDNI